MDVSQLIWGLRILVGLAIGFLIARKFRDFIRSIVIMCIPLKHRISERSFQIQTRITTIVGILLAIGIAIGLNYGLSQAMTKMGITQTTTITSAIVSPPLPIIKKSPPVLTTPKPSTTIHQETPLSVAPIEQPKVEIPKPYEIPSRSVPQKAQPNNPIKPTYQNQPAPYWQQQASYTPLINPYQATTFQLPYYAQIYAFRNLEKAKQQQIIWQQRSQLPILIGYAPHTLTPYKVIIGPFRNRPAAAYFLKSNGMNYPEAEPSRYRLPANPLK